MSVNFTNTKMKKIFFLLIIWAFTTKADAQPPTLGSYYINNTMVPFHGTWMWVSGTDTVKIFLATKKVYKDIIAGGYYTDLLVGWHIYKRGNATVETSYANINIVNGSTLMGSNSNDAPDVVIAYITDISKNKEGEVKLTLNAAQNEIIWRSSEHQGMRIYSRPQDVPPAGLTLPRNMVLVKQ